jgi:hypothetical protein
MAGNLGISSFFFSSPFHDLFLPTFAPNPNMKKSEDAVLEIENKWARSNRLVLVSTTITEVSVSLVIRT